MSDRVVTMSWKLWTSQEQNWNLIKDGVLGSWKLSSVTDEPALMELVIRGTAEAIYVSRPSERIYSYTGPCGEPDCDGHHLVGHLPRESDHGPDGWTPMLLELRVNGGTFDYRNLERLLSVCGPEDRVAQVREAVANINKRLEERSSGFSGMWA